MSAKREREREYLKILEKLCNQQVRARNDNNASASLPCCNLSLTLTLYRPVLLAPSGRLTLGRLCLLLLLTRTITSLSVSLFHSPANKRSHSPARSRLPCVCANYLLLLLESRERGMISILVPCPRCPPSL